MRTGLVTAAAALLVGLPGTAHAALDDRLVVEGSTSSYDEVWLQTLEADGSDERDVSGPEGHRAVAQPVWAPDGTSLAGRVLDRNDDGHHSATVRVFAQDGSSSQVLASDPADVSRGVTWTDDSSHVAYVAGSPTATRLALVRRDGSARAVLDTGRSDMSTLQWSPDGSLVTFASRTPEGAASLFAVAPDGTGLRLIASQAGRPDYPTPLSWSPDGDRFAYARNAPQEQETVVVVGRDGTVQRELGTGSSVQPQWSPDGRTVAWVRDGELVLSDPDTGAERVPDIQLDASQAVTFLTGWSADSRHLAVGVRVEAPNSFATLPYVVDPQTGAAVELDTELAQNKYGAQAWFSPLPTTPPATRGTDRACSGAPDAGFSDTAGSVFAAQVDCVAWYDVARGTSATTYSPGATVTRAQMALFLTRVAERAGRELDPRDAGFDDLDGLSGETREAINAVANLAVARGLSDGRFGPFAAVTRGQMASFLSRLHLAVGGEELGPRVHCFGDVSASVHKAAIEHLCGQGIGSGVAPGSYLPGASVTRGQMAGFLARLLDVQREAGLVERPS